MIFTCKWTTDHDNGHWHETYEEAIRCNTNWPVDGIKIKPRKDYSFKPHGYRDKDRKF